MAYKPLKKKYMSQFSGPLQKMIDKAVEERVNSMLKNTEDEMEMSDWEKVSSKTTDLDMSEDPRYESGTTTTDVYSRTGEDDPFEGEKTDSDTWKRQYEEAMEGGGSKGMQEYVKKYNMDGTAKTEYKEETTTDLTPAELEEIKKKEVNRVDVDDNLELQPVQRTEGSQNLATILGQNPDSVMTSNASDFFNTEFSNDNPTFDILKNDKFMRKARKEYEKMNYSGKKRQSMPFNRWLMQSYQPKGMEGTLIEQARTWEGDNATDTDSSGEGGTVKRDTETAKQSSEARYSANPDDWRKATVTGGQSGGPQFNSKSHMPTRTMAFRKPQANTGGFKMKRYAK
tara:strand:- start:814 stop:1836 length:1023 start_codon:yes stop_codon:yes gene_type:complete